MSDIAFYIDEAIRIATSPAEGESPKDVIRMNISAVQCAKETMVDEFDIARAEYTIDNLMAQL